MCQKKVNPETKGKADWPGKPKICPKCNSPIKEINLGLFSSEPLLVCKCSNKTTEVSNNETSPVCKRCGAPLTINHAHGWGGKTREKCQNPECPTNKNHTGWGG